MAGWQVFTEFCVQAILGLAIVMAGTRDAEIDPWYFRTQALVAFGFATLAALAGLGGRGWLLAGLAWVTFVLWSVGLRAAGRAAFACLALVAAWVSWRLLPAAAEGSWAWFLTFTASAVLVAAVYAAMLLGHWYLVWPWMSVRPLARALGLAATALAVRLAFSMQHVADLVRGAAEAVPTGLLAAHLLVGLGGVTVGLLLAWRCARIRSTQSATGILYAATAMALLGELAARVAAARLGLPI